MSELRFNVITKDWVIIATERAKRPENFKKPKDDTVQPEHKPDCPFCPGNEGDGKDETFRIPDGAKWKTRSIYNKYPALSPDKECTRNIEGYHNWINGFGIHEVIIEHPRHNTNIALMSLGEVEDIIRTYKQRYISIQQVNCIEAITLFKNHGPRAGASQAHPHSQLLATPMVPPHVRTQMEQAARHFDVTGKCTFCDIIERESKEQARAVLETEYFFSFVPYASALPFTISIYPKKHAASFDSIDDYQIKDLALNLKTVLAKLYKGLANPDYNFTISTAPVKERVVEYFHWHVNVMPRITDAAGFELGSFIFINSSLPEECADFLRKI